ncbi:MAG: hypothetical protein ACKVS7_06950 [Gemmatimonadaceae bacterium]
MLRHRLIRRLGLTLAAALGTASCDAEVFSPEYGRVLAENAIMEFVSGHRDEWRVVVRGVEAPAVLESGSTCGTLDLSGGRLTVSIDTPLFAVDGHSTRPTCVPPQDAVSEPECYVQRPFAVPLRLTFSVPYTN